MYGWWMDIRIWWVYSSNGFMEISYSYDTLFIVLNPFEQCSKPLLVDELVGWKTTQYIGDHNNPIEGSL